MVSFWCLQGAAHLFDTYLECLPTLGTAIFVFFTLVDNPTVYIPGITTLTAVNFTLDKMPPRQFRYTPQKTQGFLFQSLVFAQNDLPGGNHTLFISGPSNTDTSIYVNFDYAIYT